MSTAPKQATVNDEILVPDFTAALQTMFQDIRPIKDRKDSAGKDESAAWKHIKDECHLSGPAAKFFFTHILQREDETRDNNLRTLYGLMKEANIAISADLVDQMGDGEAPSMPVAPRTSEPKLETVN